jgi:hypothetical protein
MTVPDDLLVHHLRSFTDLQAKKRTAREVAVPGTGGFLAFSCSGNHEFFCFVFWYALQVPGLIIFFG